MSIAARASQVWPTGRSTLSVRSFATSTRALSSSATKTGPSASVLPHLVRPQRLPTIEEFHANAGSDAAEPRLLPGLVADWPAVREWPAWDDDLQRETLRGMRNETTAELLVEVEIGRRGRGYMDRGSGGQGGWDKIKMPFDIFLEAFVARTIPGSDDGTIGYVAQQDLLSQCPAWQRALQPPLAHSRSGPRGERGHWMRNVWIGPADTFTPIHKDPYHNLFVQVVGSKRVHLFPPSTAPDLHLSQSGTQTNTSVVPSEDYLLRDGGQGSDASQYPGLARALEHPSASHAVLHPGDALYIPRGWFHCVRSLATSVSVNDWWLQ